MVTTIQREIVAELVASTGCVAGQENTAPEKSISLNIQSRSTSIIRIYVELVEVPLQPRLVDRAWAELMEPRSLQRIVPIEH